MTRHTRVERIYMIQTKIMAHLLTHNVLKFIWFVEAIISSTIAEGGI